MKTLYMTDLDGTLLMPDASVSDRTAQIINDLTSKGTLISVSTARSIADCDYIFAALHPSAPVALMNGTLIVSPDLKRVLHFEAIDEAVRNETLKILLECGCPPNVYKYYDNNTDVIFTEFASKDQREFYEKRKDSYRKFERVKNYDLSGDVIFFSSVAEHEKVAPAAERLKKVKGLNVSFYKDVYYKNGWFLEVSSERASKANALKKIKELTGADRCVVFGDNFNDLPMFAVADRAVAVKNARDEVKLAADEVIGSNCENAVAEYILNNAAPNDGNA